MSKRKQPNKEKLIQRTKKTWKEVSAKRTSCQIHETKQLKKGKKTDKKDEKTQKMEEAKAMRVPFEDKRKLLRDGQIFDIVREGNKQQKKQMGTKEEVVHINFCSLL
ncbi:hypothetical protein V6N11_041521 [Hibiscus sabdariffa]|uniref:Uncharacterized protein n=1 Tax=Hibiscus sabdariffa TaxID=183260 RepID=A0ABR2RKR0_9ROSI